MNDTLRSVLHFFRRSEGEQTPAPLFEVRLPACLLLPDDLDESNGARVVTCETLNVSEGGLALVIPRARAGSRPPAKGETLRVTLDLVPSGTVRMYVTVLGLEPVEEGEVPSCILRARITGMSPGDRAIYLEYVGARGWQKARAKGAGAS